MAIEDSNLTPSPKGVHCKKSGTEFCRNLCDNWFECFPEPKILFNRARCRKCGTFLESKTVHDLQTCACGAISIDGGQAYIHHMAKDLNDIEDLTEYAK